MSIRVLYAAFAILVGMSASASAQEVLVGGPLYGGALTENGTFVGGTITCRVFNFGTNTIHFTQNRIFDNTGAKVVLSGDSCGTLRPAKSCAYFGQILGNLAFSCRSITTDIAESLTGTIEIQINDLDHSIVQQQPLRSGNMPGR